MPRVAARTLARFYYSVSQFRLLGAREPNSVIGGELQKQLWVSGCENLYHLLGRVGAEVHIYMGRGGSTSVTTANVYGVSTNLKCHYLVVSVAKYI